MNQFIIVGNVNCHNIGMISDILGIAGFAGAQQWLNDCEFVLNIHNHDFRFELGIIEDTDRMIGFFIRHGFTVKLLENGS